MLMVKLSLDKRGIATLTREDGKTITGIDRLHQFPGIARYFGWKACEKCDETDGSVSCAHHSVRDMEFNAFKHLWNRNGEECDDPGWWE